MHAVTSELTHNDILSPNNDILSPDDDVLSSDNYVLSITIAGQSRGLSVRLTITSSQT